MEVGYKDIESGGVFSGRYRLCLLAPPRNALMLPHKDLVSEYPMGCHLLWPKMFRCTFLKPKRKCYGLKSTSVPLPRVLDYKCFFKSNILLTLPNKICCYKNNYGFSLLTYSCSTRKIPILAGKIYHFLYNYMFFTIKSTSSK